MKRLILCAVMFLVLSIAVQASGWVDVASWQGSSNKSTETFKITGSSWGISWDHPGEGHFSIVVKSPPDKYVQLVVNQVGKTADQSIYYTPGTYFLEISATEPYSIRVCQKF